jgi:hypothetical protein
MIYQWRMRTHLQSADYNHRKSGITILQKRLDNQISVVAGLRGLKMRPIDLREENLPQRILESQTL